ncbi:sensor histidine kinase [Pseudobacteriovorax antillogorgiicola]|uniref:sensor histidine kinase n=1 Tax=Pseudobacteriovorax antillogorgiicola TaxID=1513793 RepID=UPI001046FB6C|nr:HAMP domain-containing sensor histidine kinase [Pseudobacteriovorax antillogorgiicola]
MREFAEKLGEAKFLRRRWEESHLRLFVRDANLMCIMLLLLIAPTDLLSFPEELAWETIRTRFIAIGIFLLNLLLLFQIKSRATDPRIRALYHGFLAETTLVMNGLFLYFLLTMNPSYRLAVTVACLTANIGTHFFLHRFRRSHLLFSTVFAIIILPPFLFSEVWREHLISIYIGHASFFVIAVYFRRVFYKSLQKDYLIKLQAETIKQQSKNIETSLKDKETLLRVLMHDISNPLTVIMGNEMMLSKLAADNPELIEKLKKIQQATMSINGIIKHVRDYEAVRSGKKPLQIARCSVRSCIDQAMLMIEERAQAKDITIVAKIGDEDIFCMADETNLTHQVLVNLLTNALKFSATGQVIEIIVSQQSDVAEIQVIDHGIGIPDRILRNLFSDSKTTNRMGTGGEKGTGFGMPLVKAYLDRFHGSIKVETRTIDDYPTDHGTTFTIRLPIAKNEVLGADGGAKAVV